MHKSTLRQSDYISGEIKLNDKVVSKVYGSWLSHIEFDGVRYWDIRDSIDMDLFEYENPLQSCSSLREDRKLLQMKNIESGQIAKEKLESLQRYDRKLREQFQKKK
jgi:hypothetical protein